MTAETSMTSKPLLAEEAPRSGCAAREQIAQGIELTTHGGRRLAVARAVLSLRYPQRGGLP
jgi:hypothetical protein